MLKKIIIAALGLFGLCAAALAAVPAPQVGTLPFYWISGNVIDKETKQAVAERKVIIYIDNIDKRIETTTDNLGNFKVNVYELYYYYKMAVVFDGTKYNLAVPRYGQFNKGEGPAAVALEAKAGFVTQNFALSKGGGPDLTPSPVGTVPLTISRDNSDLKINWDDTLQPQLYFLTGDGSGQFSNEFAKWKKVADKGVLVNVPKDFLYSAGLLTHQQQVGGGIGEVYYRALLGGISPEGINPDSGTTNFAAAPAVGKVNVELSRVGAIGWNLIAYPFTTRDIKDALFGNFSSADEVKIYDERIKQFTSSVKYEARAGTWQAASFVRGKGYWLYKANPNPITATAIGAVELGDLNVSLTREKANGWNFVGLPFPAVQTLAQFGAASADSADEFKFRNEATKIIDQSYKKGQWAGQAVLAAKGYLYYRAMPGPLAWKIKLK